MSTKHETWYRYDDVHYAPPLDEWGEFTNQEGDIRIELLKFRVVKHTPKGVQLVRVFDNLVCDNPPRLVLHAARKRYACSTTEEARISFLARKKKQLSIYKARCRSVERVLAKLEGSL